MVTSVLTDQRRKPKAANLIKEITGLLMEGTEESRQPFVLYDMTDDGLGLWTSEKLTSNTIKVTLGNEYGGMTLDCNVVWSQVDDKTEGFHSELSIEEAEVPDNLYQFLQAVRA